MSWPSCGVIRYTTTSSTMWGSLATGMYWAWGFGLEGIWVNGYLRKMLLECSLKVGSGNRGKTLSAVPEVFAWRSSGVDKWGVEAAEHR